MRSAVGALLEQWRLCNAARKKDDEFCRRPKCKRCNRLRDAYRSGRISYSGGRL